ncbi:DUF397 domain-containing protein [Micromonospora sp. NPDC006766]|uniref:DUF397 domain-containing protein n=1 Tax=Micromonospora sp. NPDC006766 TaxID=3154778 RepID=UPI0033CF8C17
MEASDRLVWRKSSRSDNNGGACVEVTVLDESILIRDSKDRSGPTLRFDGRAWSIFLAEMKD